MKRTGVLLVLFMIAASLGACGDDNGTTGSPTTMSVSSKSPAGGSTGVLRNAEVSAKFDKDLDCETVSKETFTVKDSLGSGVTGTVSCAADTITLASSGYAYAKTYTVTVSADVKSSLGLSLAEPVIWDFKIKAATTKVRTGADFSLARDGDGTAFSWGGTTYALGRTVDDAHPAKTPLSVDVTDIASLGAGGGHTFVSTGTGTVFGWGHNVSGQLGTGATGDSVSTPTEILLSGLTGTIIDFTGSFEHSLALDSNGNVWAAGSNCTGQLGDGTTTDSSTFKKITFPSGEKMKAIAASDDSTAPCAYFSMALDTAGKVWVWGTNAHNQLGQANTDSGGTLDETPDPVQVSGLANITAISAGWRFAAAVDSAGKVWSWGDGAQGALGDGTCGVSHSVWTPVTVKTGPGTDLTGVKSVSASRAGAQFTLALKTDGTIWGWGDNSSGQLGDGTTGIDNDCAGIASPIRGRLYAVQANGISDVADVKAGDYHAIGLRDDGTVWVWGDNTEGLLGTGSTATEELSPLEVPGI